VTIKLTRKLGPKTVNRNASLTSIIYHITASPREHQVRAPRFLGTTVLQCSAHNKSWEFSIRKFRYKIRIDPCDSLLPMLQFYAVFEWDGDEMGTKDSKCLLLKYLSNTRRQRCWSVVIGWHVPQAVGRGGCIPPCVSLTVQGPNRSACPTVSE